MREPNKEPERKHFTYETKMGGAIPIFEKLTKAVNDANSKRYKGKVISVSHVMPIRAEWDVNGQGQMVTSIFMLDIKGGKVFDSQGIDISNSDIAKNVLKDIKEGNDTTPFIPTDIIENVMNLKDDLIRRVPNGSEPFEPGNRNAE